LRHGRLERFGLFLRHDRVQMGKDEIGIESTDLEQRKSTVAVIPQSNLSSGRYIATSWRFAPRGARVQTQCVLVCRYSPEKENKHNVKHERRAPL